MQSIVQPPYPEHFAETTVTGWMRDAIEFAKATSLAVVVRGPAGMGKSSSIAHLTEEISGIRYAARRCHGARRAEVPVRPGAPGGSLR